MLRTDNVSNCYAKKLRTAKNATIELARKCFILGVFIRDTQERRDRK